MTGLGTVSPVGNTVDDAWAALLEGQSGAGPITKFDASDMKVRFACEVKDFDAEAYITRKEARRYDKFVQYAIGAAQQAVEHAGLGDGFPNPERTGVIIGSGIGGMETYEENCRQWIPCPRN